jgi:hypothetical protein
MFWEMLGLWFLGPDHVIAGLIFRALFCGLLSPQFCSQVLRFFFCAGLDAALGSPYGLWFLRLLYMGVISASWSQRCNSVPYVIAVLSDFHLCSLRLQPVFSLCSTALF